MEKSYQFPLVQDNFSWTEIPAATVATPLWGTVYCPATMFQCAYTRSGDFYVRMACQESHPTARNSSPDSPVWQDSCMEAFLSFSPDKTKYLNLEANSRGALFCAFGSTRENRLLLADMQCPRPGVETVVTDGAWSVVFKIPAATIRALWGVEQMTPDDILWGNFYKCGDKTPIPHFLSWNPIGLPQPNFHVPCFFGALTLLE